MASTTKTNSLAKMECLFLRSSINRCSRPSRSTEWRLMTNMEMRIWTNNSSSTSNKLRRTPSMKRFRKSFKSVQRTKRYSVTQSSQLMTAVSTMTHWTLLSTPWICRWSSGNVLKKYAKLEKTKTRIWSHACLKIK